MSFRRIAHIATTVACAVLLWAGPAEAQEVGTVTGQVTESATGQALVGAQIYIENSTIGALTNASGRYLLTRVPVGSRRITALLIGYGPVTMDVNVMADQSIVVDFALAQTAIALDEMVVTATGEQRKRELGNTVATVQAAEVMELAPITNAFDMLQARAPGVQVLNAGGTIGSGSRIRIRGSNSISLSNEPIIYVDGIRIESGSGQTVGLGGQSMGRLNDINPEDIESI
ncbi:carboxypeptidase-like regulatory domain-containing protein, partial [Gemmatimonadota bacterium]